jgi:hypothetical protein
MDTSALPPVPRRERLARTLLVTVAVKSLVLYVLWSTCFSQPQTRHMLLPAAEVERHLFSPAAPDSSNKK